MMNKLITLISTCAILILFSCQPDENDEVDFLLPTGFTLSRNFYYNNATYLSTLHRPADIRASASNSSKDFKFDIGVENLLGKEAAGNDFLSFKIAAETLKPGLTGAYTLKSWPSTGLGETSVYYVHYASVGVGSVFESSATPMEGFFQIQTYDSKRKLISGNFTLILRQIKDPYGGENGTAKDRKVDVAVSGSFVNLGVQ